VIDMLTSATAQSVIQAPKFTLPVLFLGYALVANAGFIQDIRRDSSEIPRAVIDYFNGDAALQIDSYYKQVMPHRLASIDLMGALRYLTFGEGRSGVVIGKDGWLFSSEEFRATGDHAVDVANAAKGIAEVRDTLAAKGIELVVVPLPAKADIYREHLADTPLPEELSTLYASFRSALADGGVKTVDTRPSILASKDKGAAFLQTDTHWTPLGAEVTAAAVGEAIGQQFATTQYRVADVAPVPRQGDLSKFIVSGPLALSLGLGPETVTPREAQAQGGEGGGLDLFGDSAIPVALVGTSYSANDQWSFGESLKAALGTDVLNVAEEGLGPVAPMRKYLASDTLRDAPPKLVIWEFPIRYLENRKLWDASASEAK
jgi:alginate O-acetyltransferase complex protein AlgJ